MLTGSRSNLLALLTAVVHGVLLLQQFLVPSVCGYYLPALLRPGSVGVPHPGTPGAPPARIRGSAADPTAAPFGYGMAPDGSGVIALKSPRTPDGRGRLWNIDRRASVNGAGVFNGTDTGAGRGYIRLPLQREVVNTTGWPNETHPSIARRWGWSRLEDFRGIVYLIELQIGDPPQPIKVLIDTGSFELWVNPTCANTVDARFCESLGRYNPRRSSTAKLIDGSEFLLYYYGGWAQGQYYLDKLHIASKFWKTFFSLFLLLFYLLLLFFLHLSSQPPSL